MRRHEHCDIVDTIEAARRLEVETNTVVVWRLRKRNGFPEPTFNVSGRPAWCWLDILEWARATNRLTD